MNLITDTWRGLVRRKLWPVALLLVGALVAVPMFLAKEPEVTPAPANAQAQVEGLPATYVTAATEDSALEEDATSKRHRALGAEKDPFEPAPLPKAKKKKTKKATKTSTAKTEPAATETDSAKTEPSTGSGDAGGGASEPSAPVATPTPTATPTPAPDNSVRVRFTRVEETTADELPAVTVEELSVLPDEENPVVVFQGLEKKGKIAVFELTGNATVEGDGECEPSPTDCRIVRLRAGETVFITVKDTGEETDAQYQLDLVKINR
ncbi:hypothetical protein DVA67_011560 [Solirubrobacter sp. CPCC 204708]|uniref:Cadherin-like beta sandwich domain-containing protein n=1 Tax=Solirubrobacter deserti TaxID=2282478 RepID=A0ABT4RPL7_9ACTN|nr:hypothetical protein [Solirubrobacter deserti]MBE2316616.1 hypothetical protein [Solirubrobacter deserti]MDA0140514.1 hypothetical protein [Solirubrobacter deserti]